MDESTTGYSRWLPSKRSCCRTEIVLHLNSSEDTRSIRHDKSTLFLGKGCVEINSFSIYDPLLYIIFPIITQQRYHIIDS